MPTSIPEKVHVHVKNEGKDNKKNGGKEDKKVQGKDHDHKKDVQLKKVVAFPPAGLKDEIKEIAKSDKEFKPDLDEINEKIWNSIKNEIRHKKERIDCKRIIKGDEDYIKLEAKSRLTYTEPRNLFMDCRSIKERNYFLEKPLSTEEGKYPLAYARIVYKDYRILEAELATNYRPQNWYCFAIDSKARELFGKRMRSLAKCFKNIIIPNIRYPVDRDGQFAYFLIYILN
uniref:Uncharacterized protein n=1 Tax=Meloidogyne enterolobii TaxID=390850 RepID=A0A6V7UJ93_MELEN|nr:unnamed protein product [Meloidogyne enterolobii]